MLLAVTGLAREVRILRRCGLPAVCLAGDAAEFAAGAGAILSIGIAGGLAADLHPGAWLVAERVDAVATDPAWSARLAGLLGARRGVIAGADRAVMTAADKAALRARTGGDAVDMESNLAARVAQRLGLRFAAARVVADPAERDLPPLVGVAIGRDGRVDRVAVIRALLRRPGQAAALVRVAVDAERAFAALRRGGRAIAAEPGHGLPDML